MEITKQTNELLENLSMINKNFLFNKGKVQPHASPLFLLVFYY